jgi:hypothetical protein
MDFNAGGRKKLCVARPSHLLDFPERGWYEAEALVVRHGLLHIILGRSISLYCITREDQVPAF